MDGHRGAPYRTIEVTPYSPHVGAEIGGIDLTRPLPAEQLAELVRLIGDGTLSGKLAKEVFSKMFDSGRSAGEIVEAEGLKQISDQGELRKIIDEILANNQKQVETYRGGKTGVLGFFIGQVMKATRGQADPKVVNNLLREALG